ncbi:WD repeat-containing protein 55, partial [Elysia marginata]
MATPSHNHVSDAPADISYEDTVTTVQCHPSEDILAAGLITGDIIVSSFGVSESSQELHKFPHHKKACRALRFSEDGKRLYSASKDKSLLCFDVETGKVKKRIKNAHESAIYSLVVTGDKFVATGDDDGVLKVWDMRTKTCTVEMKECDDFISDMIVDDNKKLIIASSGEGTLTAFNIRRKRMEMQSELFDSELLCLAKMKQGQKLICGTGEGTLNLFNWGEWGNLSDRFPCGDAQINCIMPVTEYVAVIGTDDGFL